MSENILTYEEAKTKHKEAIQNYDKKAEEYMKELCSLNIDWDQYCNKLSIYLDKMNETYVLLLSYTESVREANLQDYSPSGNSGDYMSIKNFIESCECKDLIDDDGSGLLCIGNKVTDYGISPSTIIKYKDKINRIYDGVLWFNK